MTKSRLVAMVFYDTDPFFVRELLALLAGLLGIETFFGSFRMYSNSIDSLLYSLSSGYSLSLIIYASVVSGYFARSIERGSLGYLMTMPLRRKIFVTHFEIQAIVITSVVFLIPISFIDYLSSSTLQPEIILVLFALSISFLFFYISTGYLIAASTGNSIFTLIFDFGVFLLLQSYSAKIFPKSLPGQFIFSGFSYFANNPSLELNLLPPTLVIVIISTTFTLFVYPIIHFRGLRSGR